MNMRYEKAENILILATMMQATRVGVSLQDIMDKFNVSRRTAERMRDAVEHVFSEMEYVQSDERVKRCRIPPRALPNALQCNAEQLSTLDYAARAMLEAGQTDKAEHLKHIMMLLKASMHTPTLSRAEPDIEALSMAEGIAMRPGPGFRNDPVITEALRHAVLSMMEVEITYGVRHKEPSSQYILQPYGFLHGRKSYLVAKDAEHDDIRLWLLPNIQEVTPTNQMFQRDERFDLQKYAEKSFGVFQEPAQKVVLEFGKEVATDVHKFHFHATQEFENIKNGKIRVTFFAGGVREICWHLFTWGRYVNIVSPTELRETYRTMCEDALKKQLGDNDE